VGDSWTYVATISDGRSGASKTEVNRVSPGEIVVTRGNVEVTYSEPWTMVRSKSGNRALSIIPGLATTPFPLAVGDTRRQTVVTIDEPAGSKRTHEAVTMVKGWEDVVVPAGKFRAIRIDREETNGTDTPQPRKTRTSYWYVPGVRWHVQVENFDVAKGLRVTDKLENYSVR
jgi:hypothetical protein